MDNDLEAAISILRAEGYAVVIFNPEELDGAPSDIVELIMVQRGWDAISNLRPMKR